MNDLIAMQLIPPEKVILILMGLEAVVNVKPKDVSTLIVSLYR